MMFISHKKTVRIHGISAFVHVIFMLVENYGSLYSASPAPSRGLIGHDDDPLPSNTPIEPEDNASFTLIVDYGYDSPYTFSTRISSFPINYTLNRTEGGYKPNILNFSSRSTAVSTFTAWRG